LLRAHRKFTTIAVTTTITTTTTTTTTAAALSPPAIASVAQPVVMTVYFGLVG